MAAEGESFKRQVAHKVHVSDILNNRYIKEEGWLPNYISVGDKKVSRVNLLGVVVSIDSTEEAVASQNFIVDDGTGRIALRFFEQGAKLGVGDIITVIGRPREFGADRYIVPEIVRRISDSKWIEVRKLELALDKKVSPIQASPAESLDVEVEEVRGSDPVSSIIGIIRGLDSGEGVAFDEISVKFKGGDPEQFIRRLLVQGDIFEVKPGRYKVLE